MSQIKEEVLSANAQYASNFGDKGDLPMPPGRRFAVLTCMDARLDPAKYAGFPKVMHTWFEMQAAVPATMPFVLSSFPTNYWERGMVCRAPYRLRHGNV